VFEHRGSSCGLVRDISASDGLAEAQQAIREKDAVRLETALRKFRKAFEPLREAAKKAAR
jgi:hypothetical protein